MGEPGPEEIYGMPNSDKISYLVFNLLSGRYALLAARAERVLAAAETTPLPNAPEAVRGVINLGGEILPVFDLKRRFNLPAREMRLSDQFIIARSAGRRVALLTDGNADFVEAASGEVTELDGVVKGTKYLKGVLNLEGALVLIHDLDAFLSGEESARLDGALEAGRGGTP